MITRLMRLTRWIGHNGISAVIAEQFGTAMMPLCSRIRLPLISGITSGTFGSIRNAEELSMTTAPAFTADGENFRDVPPPAENSAMSTPSKERSVSSSMTMVSPRKLRVLPAERALASAFNFRTGKPRLSMVAMNSAPTAPVTPAIATTASFFTVVSTSKIILSNKKAPVLFRRGFGSDDAIVRLRAHGSRAPRGCFGFHGRFGRDRHGADLCGSFEPPSTVFGLMRASTDGPVIAALRRQEARGSLP